MKNIFTLIALTCAFAFTACDKKPDASKTDPPKKELEIKVEPEAAKEAASTITEANVESEADKLLKEIEADNE